MLLTLITVLCFGLVSSQIHGGSQGQQNQPHIASVLQELSAITAARSDLNAQLTRRKADLEKIKRQEAERKAACDCGQHSDYAFNAFLNANVPNFGEKMEVPFTDVTLNHGDAYDARHSTFRAPINGTYLFAVTVGTQATHTIAVDVIYNITPVMKIRTSSDNTWRMVTNTMIISLKAGDDVWVRHSTTADSNYLYVAEGMYTSFSGHLVSKE